MRNNNGVISDHRLHREKLRLKPVGVRTSLDKKQIDINEISGPLKQSERVTAILKPPVPNDNDNII